MQVRSLAFEKIVDWSVVVWQGSRARRRLHALSRVSPVCLVCCDSFSCYAVPTARLVCDSFHAVLSQVPSMIDVVPGDEVCSFRACV
jgi:hypothetical protein